MLVVAGFSLKSVEPRVWDRSSRHYLSDLGAVMVSYAEIQQLNGLRRRMMEEGLHAALGIPLTVNVFLDNGSFALSQKGKSISFDEYEEFVRFARPDWRPIPQDFIPAPSMSPYKQRKCQERTMKVNRDFRHDGFVPVMHIGGSVRRYVKELKQDEKLMAKPYLAIGGIVPNLLRAPKALSYSKILDQLIRIRNEFSDKKIHIFGIGGTATLHLAALLRTDSVDSCGWRNRAARGIIQLQGRGDRTVADLGSWAGRKIDTIDAEILEGCKCPICGASGSEELKKTGSEGFRNRATHNLWTLLAENRWISEQLAAETYAENYPSHLMNSVYRPIVDLLVSKRFHYSKHR